MDKVPLWKPAIIILVVGLCAAMMYFNPFQQGLDLKGGTTLIYQVNVPPGVDAKQDIDNTIVALKKRVDPTNSLSSSWEQLAGNRIQIQIPVGSAESEQRRAEYLKARDELTQGNLSVLDVDAALRAPPAVREAQFARLAAGDPQRLAALEALAKADAQLTALDGPRRAAQAAKDQAQAALNAMPFDAGEAKKAPLVAKLKALQADLTAKAQAYLDMRKQVEVARSKVNAFNVDLGQLERIFALPPGEETAAAPQDTSKAPPKTRQSELKQLIEAHPARAADIKNVAAAYAEYEKVKGTLDDPNDLIELLRSSGVLEFRIAAKPTDPEVQSYVERLQSKGPRSGEGRFIWVPIDDEPTSFAKDDAEMTELRKNPTAYFRDRMRMVAQPYGKKIYVLLGNTPENSLTHDQQNWQLTDAEPDADDLGFPAVSFQLDAAGGEAMGKLTGAHVEDQMAIVLDGKVMSAPTLKDRINGRGRISGGVGGFQPKEQEYLIRTLKAGSLKVRLSDQPISIQKVGSTFGQDNLHKSLTASWVTMVIICAFMAAYYFMLGIIADFALIANVVIILGVMAFKHENFTLPGIAGIILTLGMAVDANVLVFERIREELARGNPVKTALRLGYSKVMPTIIDTHLTTIITCVILYYMGTADVKGFAATLLIGLIASFFTAVYCSHVWLEMWIRLPFVKTLNMLPVKYPRVHDFFAPNIDWYGKRYFFVGISLVLTIGGMIGIAMRGRDFLDIEFRSGTEVGFSIREGQPGMEIKTVRQRLDAESAKLSDQYKTQVDALKEQVKAAGGENAPADLKAKLAQAEDDLTEAGYLNGDRATVATVGDTTGTSAKAFSIATLATNTNLVTDAIKDAFRDMLSTQQPVAFAAMGNLDAANVLRPPIAYALHSLDLGDDIGRPDVHTDVPAEYAGGVAIVLRNLKPAMTTRDLRARIESARLQVGQEESVYHPYELIGLNVAGDVSATQPAAATDAAATTAPAAGQSSAVAASAGEPLYDSIVVIARDDQTNYAQNPDTLSDSHGLADSMWRLLNTALRRDTSLESVSSFSSQISGTIKTQAIAAIVVGWAVMLIYLWIRFGNLRFGVGAVIALIHDVITAIGLAALAYYVYDTWLGRALLLQPFRVNLSLVAAAMTLIGYSVNDTIVVFDRIRENRGKLTVLTAGLINDSINQTISRTVLTAGTVLIACFCLYVLGGEAIRGFAFVMLVGSIVGCYSSIAVASPLLLVWRKEPVADHAPRAGATPAPAMK